MRTDGDAPSATHEGTTYHFCSDACRRTFEDDPAAFEGEPPGVTHRGHDH